MTANLLMPLLSTLIMLVFTCVVMHRYFTRGGLHFLFWGLGLMMFTTASLAETYLAIMWNRWAFFCWYFFGAALNAAWMGHGTLQLLFSGKRVIFLTVLLMIGSLAALALMLQVMPRLDGSRFIASIPISEQYSTIMPPVREGAAIRLATPFFNIYGVVALVGGAAWSSYPLWRKGVLLSRGSGNVLIATGGLVVSFYGVLTRMGFGEWLYIAELLAAVLLFAGFLVSSRRNHKDTEHIPDAR